MQPLADASNVHRQQPGSKRQRLEDLQQPATFERVVSPLNGSVFTIESSTHTLCAPQQLVPIQPMCMNT
jgi:hypothetical protein